MSPGDTDICRLGQEWGPTGLNNTTPRGVEVGRGGWPAVSWMGSVSLVLVSNALGFSKHVQFAKAWEVIGSLAVWERMGAEDILPQMTPPASFYCNAAATLRAPSFKA